MSSKNNVVDLSEADLQGLPPRALWERTARAAHQAYEQSAANRQDIVTVKTDVANLKNGQLDLSEKVGGLMSSNARIEKRLGIVEGREVSGVEWEALALTERKQDLAIRKERWDLILSFGRETIKWLFVGGGGAGLYALARYLLG